tara:strand:- start:8650 stop:9042 length:393 start_codon:yes stop_codon:yes gene_type:complete
MYPIRQTSLKNKYCVMLGLLAMALSFLSHIAPLWASQPDGTSIVICSTLGTKTITIDDDGNKIPDTPDYKPKHCVMCVNASMHAVSAQDYAHVLPPFLTPTSRGSLPEGALFKTRLSKHAHGIRAPPLTA